MRLFFLVLLPVAATVTVTLAADEKKPRPDPATLTLGEIMVQAHVTPRGRGTRDNLDSKMLDGKATADEKERLLALYTELSYRRPPKGDAEAWAKRTTALVDATKDVLAGKEKAAERFRKAQDCKGCHTDHRVP